MPFLWRSEGKVERNVQQQANKPYTFRYIVQIPVRPKYLEYIFLEFLLLNPHTLAQNKMTHHGTQVTLHNIQS
jgi:hypothetical protein